MQATKIEDKLQNIIKKVACPFDALTTNGETTQCYCSYNQKIYKNKLGDVALGSIEEDILNHCGNCTFRTAKASEEFKLLTLDKESQCVTCPATAEQVNLVDTCKTCVFLHKKKLKELLDANPDSGMEDTGLPCTYPNPLGDNLILGNVKKTKVVAKTKKAPKIAAAG